MPIPIKLKASARTFPSTINLSIIDEIVQLTDKECFDATRALARQEGIYTGGSGGAAVLGAIQYAEKMDREMNIVVLLPDSVRYLNKIFDDDWMRENRFLDPEESLGSIRDMLAMKNPKVIVADKTEKIENVIEAVKSEGISQVPIVSGGQLVGIVNESSLLEVMLKEAEMAEATVETVMTDSFGIADPDAPVVFNHIFRQGKVVVV